MLYDDDPRRHRHIPIWSEDRKVPPSDKDARRDSKEDEVADEHPLIDESDREA